MTLKFCFDFFVALLGLLLLWPLLIIVAILIKLKMPGGPAFFIQKRIGKNGKLFNCHKFRTMIINHNGSTVSVSGDNRITPLGAKLRHYKIDELPFKVWRKVSLSEKKISLANNFFLSYDFENCLYLFFIYKISGLHCRKNKKLK